MSAAVIDEATGVIYTKSALASPPEAPQVLPSMGQVNMLWQHYKTARSTLERLVEGGGEKAPVDVHSPYAERAVRLLEVLILRKEKVCVGGWRHRRSGHHSIDRHLTQRILTQTNRSINQ